MKKVTLLKCCDLIIALSRGKYVHNTTAIRYSPETLAKLLASQQFPVDALTGLSLLTGFLRGTCQNDVSSFRSSILAAHGRSHGKKSYELHSILSQSNIGHGLIAANMEEKVYLPRRCTTTRFSAQTLLKFPPSRFNVVETTLYSGEIKDLVKAGNLKVDLTDIVPSGQTASGIPYVDYRANIGEQPSTVRVLLNEDNSCGKYTLEELGDTTVLPEGPLSKDDFTKHIADFDDQYQIVDFDEGSGFRPPTEERGPRKRIARMRGKREDGTDFTHWSPIFDSDDATPAGDILSLEAAYKNISALLKGAVTIPSKMEIPTTAETSAPITPPETTTALHSVLSQLTFSASGLSVVPSIRNSLNRITERQYKPTWDAYKRVFITPAIGSVDRIGYSYLDQAMIVPDNYSLMIPLAFKAHTITKSDKNTYTRKKADGYTQLTPKFRSIEQEMSLSTHSTTVLDSTRRASEFISTWITRLDFLKNINDYLKLYTGSTTPQNTVSAPMFSNALQHFARGRRTGFDTFALNLGLRLITLGATISTGTNTLFDSHAFKWPTTRPKIGRITLDSGISNTFPYSPHHQAKETEVSAYHIPLSIYTMLLFSDTFEQRDINNAIWRELMLPQLVTADDRRTFLRDAWRPAIVRVFHNHDDDPPQDPEEFFDALIDPRKWIEDLDTRDQIAARTLFSAYNFWSLPIDFITGKLTAFSQFPVTIKPHDGFDLKTFAPIPLTETDYALKHSAIDKVLAALPFPFLISGHSATHDTTYPISTESMLKWDNDKDVILSAAAQRTAIQSPYKSVLFVDVVPRGGHKAARWDLGTAGDMQKYTVPFTITNAEGGQLLHDQALDVRDTVEAIVTDCSDLPRLSTAFSKVFTTLLTPEERGRIFTILTDSAAVAGPTQTASTGYLPHAPRVPLLNLDSYHALGAEGPRNSDVITDKDFDEIEPSTTYLENLDDLNTTPTLHRFTPLSADIKAYDTPDFTVPQLDWELFTLISSGILVYEDFQAEDPTLNAINDLQWISLFLDSASILGKAVDQNLSGINVTNLEAFYPWSTDDIRLNEQREILHSSNFIYSKLTTDWNSLGVKNSYPTIEYNSGTEYSNIFIRNSSDVIPSRGNPEFTPGTMTRESFDYKARLGQQYLDGSLTYVKTDSDAFNHSIIHNDIILHKSLKTATTATTTPRWRYRWHIPSPASAWDERVYNDAYPLFSKPQQRSTWHWRAPIKLAAQNSIDLTGMVHTFPDPQDWNGIGTAHAFVSSKATFVESTFIAPKIESSFRNLRLAPRGTSAEKGSSLKA